VAVSVSVLRSRDCASRSLPGSNSAAGLPRVRSMATLKSQAPAGPVSMSLTNSKHPHLEAVTKKLDWMRENKIWPNGLRYLWTDAHGILLLISLYNETGDDRYLSEAERVVGEVKRVLGRKRGYRIGEAPDRDGQYFHYLTKWMYALNELGKFKSQYRNEAIQLVKDIHASFFIPNVGFIWKMKEDLSGPYPGYGIGGLDHYDAYTVYRAIDEHSLANEIRDVQRLVLKTYTSYRCTQDLGLGETLWMAHHFPNEAWARYLTSSCLSSLEQMWRQVDESRGYFTRDLRMNMVIAFSNFGVSIGCQAAGVWHKRVRDLHNFFATFASHDEYDFEAITHVMHCNSLLPGVLIKRSQGCDRDQEAQAEEEAGQ